MSYNQFSSAVVLPEPLAKWLVIGSTTISAQIQDGPVKDYGVNGCQIDDLLYVITEIIRDFNKRYPCRENSLAITNLEQAHMWLEKRKKNRELQGVEGQDKAHVS